MARHGDLGGSSHSLPGPRPAGPLPTPAELPSARATRCTSGPRRRPEPRALRDRALLEVMSACELRLSEAIDLQVSDVDLEQGMLRARGKGSKEHSCRSAARP